MAFNIGINTQKEFLHIRAEGVIQPAEIDGYYEKLSHTEGAGQCKISLVDLTYPGMSLREVSLLSVRNMGWQFKVRPIMPKGSKMAFVAKKNLVYGFVRVFMARRGEDLEIMVFSSMEEAMAWLEIEVSDLVLEDVSS